MTNCTFSTNNAAKNGGGILNYNSSSPIIMETNPNYINLFGSIESSISRVGILQTDFTKIKAGSLLQAHGGYLVINALDALSEIGIWPTLKRTLRNQTLEIQNPTSLYFVSTSRLKPEPIEINVKLVMIGDAHLYNLLYFRDDDFKTIYSKIKKSDGRPYKNSRNAVGGIMSLKNIRERRKYRNQW